MKAMILAAGKGTRLKPLTDHIPKALVKIDGVPLLEIIIRRLSLFGYHDLIINLHHFGEQIRDFVAQEDSFGQQITFSDERDLLLDTGGGLQKAAPFFNDERPFLVHNVDILSDLDLDQLRTAHEESQSLGTLAVRHRTTSRYFRFDQELFLKGWINHKTGETKPAGVSVENTEELAFSGIQILDPEIFSHMNHKGAYSLTDLYLNLCTSRKIKGFIHDEGYWSDVGKPEELALAEDWFKKQPLK